MRLIRDISFMQQTTRKIYAARWVERKLVPVKDSLGWRKSGANEENPQ